MLGSGLCHSGTVLADVLGDYILSFSTSMSLCYTTSKTTLESVCNWFTVHHRQTEFIVARKKRLKVVIVRRQHLDDP